MKKKEYFCNVKKINVFKTTQDYKDIIYMIQHVKDYNTRCDVLKCLGYHIGIDLEQNEKGEGNIIIGKRQEIRMQVTPKDKYNMSKCVIIEKNKK